MTIQNAMKTFCKSPHGPGRSYESWGPDYILFPHREEPREGRQPHFLAQKKTHFFRSFWGCRPSLDSSGFVDAGKFAAAFHMIYMADAVSFKASSSGNFY